MYLKISRTKFFFVTALIALLPVSVHYRLLLFGSRTTAEAISYEVQGGTIDKRLKSFDIQSTLFQFTAGNTIYRMRGPSNSVYELGEKRRVIYDTRNPMKHMMPSIAYMYSFNRALLPGLLLIVWVAFYTSFRVPE